MSFGVFTRPLIAMALIPATLFWAASSFAQSIESLKKTDEEIRQVMVQMSRQLGVTCNACHNPKDFRDSSMREWKISKDHMRLTQLLIDNGMNGQNGAPKADCYMCHRGQLKPNYKEPLDPMLMKKESKAGKSPQTSSESESP